MRPPCEQIQDFDLALVVQYTTSKPSPAKNVEYKFDFPVIPLGTAQKKHMIVTRLYRTAFSEHFGARHTYNQFTAFLFIQVNTFLMDTLNKLCQYPDG